MWDTSVEKVHLEMELNSLEHLPQHPLPERYGWRIVSEKTGIDFGLND